MKATYVEVDGEGREIFKNPITDDGGKKSAKGLLMVGENMESKNYALLDQVTWDGEDTGFLQLIFEDGKFSNVTTLADIRKKLE
jgi:nicotinamide phosphoribosyltransferase